jgi:hypothetical protein
MSFLPPKLCSSNQEWRDVVQSGVYRVSKSNTALFCIQSSWCSVVSVRDMLPAELISNREAMLNMDINFVSIINASSEEQRYYSP